MTELLLGAILLGASLEDGRRNTISNWWVASIFLLACGAIYVGDILPVTALSGVAVVGGVLLFGAIQKGSVGGGDVKICAALGALCGGLTALVIIIYALVGMILVSKIRRVDKSAFAPFLFVGFLIYMGTQKLL